MTRKRDSQLIFLSWILWILVVCPDVLTWLVFDNNISVFLINTWIIMIFFEILSCCGLIFYFGSMSHVVYRHERAARILAKQLCFNLRFLKNEKKSAVKVMAIVIGLFLVFSACSLRCSLIYIMKEEQPCNDKKFKLLSAFAVWSERREITLNHLMTQKLFQMDDFSFWSIVIWGKRYLLYTLMLTSRK